MKIKKRNMIRIIDYSKISKLLIIACLIGIWVISVNSQMEEKMNNKITAKQTQTSLQNSDEIGNLIKTLKNQELKKAFPQLIWEAIEKLGSIRDERAIPELIKYIDYEKKFEPRQKQDSNEITHWDDPKPISGRYPATAALFQIGKPALPALVKVIEAEDAESIKSQNALYTVQFIFRDNLSEGIKYLEKSINEFITKNEKSRLQKAIEDTREKQLKLQNLKSN